MNQTLLWTFSVLLDEIFGFGLIVVNSNTEFVVARSKKSKYLLIRKPERFLIGPTSAVMPLIGI
jgi:hypothetical protein